MLPIPYRKLFRVAILTAPVIGLILATPMMIVAKLPLPLMGIAYVMISGFILIAWTLNIGILRYLPEKISRRWPRIILSTLVVAGISTMAFFLLRPKLPVSDAQLHIVRTATVLAVNIIIFVVSELLLTRHSKERVDRENAELKLANLESQFKLLKEQVNPHFLFNALGTARSLVRRDPATAEEYILRLSEFLRLSLGQGKDLVTLAEELRLCEDYLSLQKMRFQDALDFKVNLKPGDEEKLAPYFGLLTLAENAIKHNTMTREAPLTISVTSDGGTVTVTNNLQARVHVAPLSRKGLHNLGERHRLLTGRDLKVEETLTHFRVTLALTKA